MKKPIVWTIAGSDSSGGAGIQSDLKTFNALEVHGCSILTAITAQNLENVIGIEYLSVSVLNDQWESLIESLAPTAIKIGMPGNRLAIEYIAGKISSRNFFTVIDPVMAATSGHHLIEPEIHEIFTACLLPLADLLTPNILEAETLLKIKIESYQDIEAAAVRLLDFGPKSVLIKGGHVGGKYSQDFWTNRKQKAWLTSPRLKTSYTHGTGCALSSAIAACRGLGLPGIDALIIAKAYVTQGLKKSYALGNGQGTLLHQGWPDHSDTFPYLSTTIQESAKRVSFPNCGEEPIGLYPIVDRVEWVKKLLSLGVATIQLRIKDLKGQERENEILLSIEYARKIKSRLFVNDQWELAIKYGAYGVHLGQDDLETVDIHTLAQSGLRLGISTHSYAEIARAIAYQPSYIALGTLFETGSKVMDYPPLGLERFKQMRKLIPTPTVAIGGINLESASHVLEAGADGLAVISNVRYANDLPKLVEGYRHLTARIKG
ncbi:MAG: bifunctional hydroxymethylpyrimidine kinase/phosphomethylpyrimidine kinase [Kiritimatiellae bacterium]|nr:bifunctional hydroxymethylpyrimidine kinase/phosphomethylpyrimidine kinase [Kiritimatiellia bacterium]